MHAVVFCTGVLWYYRFVRIHMLDVCFSSASGVELKDVGNNDRRQTTAKGKA